MSALQTKWHDGYGVSAVEEFECPMKGSNNKVPLFVSKKCCITGERRLSAGARRDTATALNTAASNGNKIAIKFLENNYLLQERR
jgi:hypothetical protein